MFALEGNYDLALAFIVTGAIFDFFDGFTARLLHVSSLVGKELDSLADCITFGFAPSAAIYSMLRSIFPAINSCNQTYNLDMLLSFVPYLAFVLAGFSALRLANFNLDERQTTVFIGMPTPANALLWIGIASWIGRTELYVDKTDCGLMAGDYIAATLILAGLCLSCWLLICEIPMLAMKFKTFAFRPNVVRYSFLFSCLFLVVLRDPPLILSAIIVLYICVSVGLNAIGWDVE